MTKRELSAVGVKVVAVGGDLGGDVVLGRIGWWIGRGVGEEGRRGVGGACGESIGRKVVLS
jgi:hypothetical protein